MVKNSILSMLQSVSNKVDIEIIISTICMIAILTILVVLCCKKSSYFDVKHEKAMALKKYEVSECKIINTYIDKLSCNGKLMTILHNYALQHDIPIPQLEFASLPLKEERSISLFDNFKKPNIFMDNWILYIDIDFIYIFFIKNFNNDIIQKNITNVRAAYDLRDNHNCSGYSESLKSKFGEMKNLYCSLRNQKIIIFNDNKYCYYAFLFLLYRESCKIFHQQAIKRLEYYNIGVNVDDDEIITGLFNNDVEQDLITTTIWALHNGKNNFNSTFCKTYDNINIEVSQLISNLKEKEKIEKLLNNDDRIYYNLPMIDLMSGEQFEHFVAYLFNSLGYNATCTKLSGDQGIDVIAKKGETIIAIQTKCYTKSVGNHAIMEAVAGAKYYKANRAMVVTNSRFTKSAVDLAKNNNVILWDRKILNEKLKEIYSGV